MKNKKGELTTQQIVGLVILIVSFAVILFFIFRLNLQEETDEQICHNSVILKSKSFIQGGGGSLDCKTSYICISGGGECRDINPSKTISVNPSDKEEIFSAIVDEMSRCWWMFGEGKIDYVNSGDKAVGTNVCAICSIVKFDDAVKSELKEISYEDFINLGLTNMKDGKQTYLNYIYGVNNAGELYDKFPVIKSDVDSNKVISLDGRYVIRTGIAKGALWGETGFDDNEIIYPYFFESGSPPEPQCETYLTKA